MTGENKSNVFCNQSCRSKKNCLELRIGEAIMASEILGKEMAENMAIPVEIHTLLAETAEFVFPRVTVISNERKDLFEKLDKDPRILTQIAIGKLKDEMTPGEAVFVLCNGKENLVTEDIVLQKNLLKIIRKTTDEDAAMRATKTMVSPFVIETSNVAAIVFLGVRMRKYPGS